MKNALAMLVLVALPAAAEVQRDPTAPPQAARAASAEVAHAQPRLTSVLIAADRRVAVIDGLTLAEGESRAGMKLVAVRPNGATVNVNGAAIELHLDGAQLIKERSPQ